MVMINNAVQITPRKKWNCCYDEADNGVARTAGALPPEESADRGRVTNYIPDTTNQLILSDRFICSV